MKKECTSVYDINQPLSDVTLKLWISKTFKFCVLNIKDQSHPILFSDLNVDGSSQEVDDDLPTTSRNSSRRSSDRCKARRMNSNLNLDGATAWDNSDSDFEEPCSSSSSNINT